MFHGCFNNIFESIFESEIKEVLCRYTYVLHDIMCLEVLCLFAIYTNRIFNIKIKKKNFKVIKLFRVLFLSLYFILFIKIDTRNISKYLPHIFFRFLLLFFIFFALFLVNMSRFIIIYLEHVRVKFLLFLLLFFFTLPSNK